MSWTITPQTKVPVDPYRSQVSLLLHGDGANGSTTITDSSPTPKTVTAVGNSQISTAVADPFGNSTRGVLAFDGNGDTLQVPKLGLINTDFTIEAWVRLSGTGSSQILVTTYNTTAFQVGTFIVSRTSTNTINFQNAFGVGVTSSALTVGSWYYVAAVYQHSSTTAQLFINGVSQGTASYSLTVEAPNLHIGGSSGDNNIGTFWFNGYIDDLRITKGVARYTANFTPPTAPFPDI